MLITNQLITILYKFTKVSVIALLPQEKMIEHNQ